MSDNCKDCFNGCLEIVPDNCVKYTGVNIPILSIATGDSLAYVEGQIFKYILSFITGKGIKIDLADIQLCNIISSNLSTTGDINLEDIVKSLIEGVCLVNDKITTLTSQLTVLEADYTISCLTGVVNTSNTHEVLQATINKICALQTSFTALLNNLATNYITSSNINTYITNYNQTVGNSLLISSKMIPYVASPYFPTVAAMNGKFDSTGAGIGTYEKVYLCNGNNGTPDLRGRTLVGATTGMLGGTLDNNVNPSPSNYPNPNYGINSLFGQNAVQLSQSQLPSHSHNNTAVSQDVEGHEHTYIKPIANGSATGAADNHPDGPLINAKTSKEFVKIITTVNISSTGGNSSHLNIQPSIGAYYIMYIP